MASKHKSWIRFPKHSLYVHVLFEYILGKELQISRIIWYLDVCTSIRCFQNKTIDKGSYYLRKTLLHFMEVRNSQCIHLRTCIKDNFELYTSVDIFTFVYFIYILSYFFLFLFCVLQIKNFLKSKLVSFYYKLVSFSFLNVSSASSSFFIFFAMQKWDGLQLHIFILIKIR